MVPWLERYLNHKGIYARNERKEGEAQRVLHHRCKYQLVAIVSTILHLLIFKCCVDQYSADNTSWNWPLRHSIGFAALHPVHGSLPANRSS